MRYSLSGCTRLYSNQTRVDWGAGKGSAGVGWAVGRGPWAVGRVSLGV